MQTFLLGILEMLLLAFDVPASEVAEAALAVMMVDVGLGILIWSRCGFETVSLLLGAFSGICACTEQQNNNE